MDLGLRVQTRGLEVSFGGVIYPDSSKGFVCGSEGIIHSPEGMIDPRLPISQPDPAWLGMGHPKFGDLHAWHWGYLPQLQGPWVQRNATQLRNATNQLKYPRASLLRHVTYQPPSPITRQLVLRLRVTHPKPTGPSAA